MLDQTTTRGPMSPEDVESELEMLREIARRSIEELRADPNQPVFRTNLGPAIITICPQDQTDGTVEEIVADP